MSFPGFDEFSFANGAVKEGPQEDRRYDWYRGDYALSDEDTEAPLDAGAASGQTRPLKSVSLTLDGAGGGRAQLSGIPKQDTPQEIVAELEYSDPNGEVLTSSTRIPVWPAQIVLGLKPDSWALSKDKIKYQAVALDLAGQAGQRGEDQARSVRAQDVLAPQAPGRRVLRLPERKPRSSACRACARARPTTRAACSASSLRRCPVEITVQAQCAGRGGQYRVRQQLGLGRRGRRVVVRSFQRRSHGRAPREEALRAGREGRIPGAHAVPQGHGAGHRRARRA